MGELAPVSGYVEADGPLGYLPQDVVRARDADPDGRHLAELLGISPTIAALARIEAGSVDQADFDMVGEDWDIVARAQALLARHVPSLGSPADLTRTLNTLSGGEILQIGMLGLLLRSHKTILLDEPTNNLDARTREQFFELVDSWTGQLLIVTHDIGLLARVDQTAEVRDGSVRLFDGGYNVYLEAIAREQEAIECDVRDAERDSRLARKARADAQQRAARSSTIGKKAVRDHKYTRMGAGARCRSAQEHAGRERVATQRAQAAADARRDAAERRLRVDESIHIELPDPHVAASRDLAELHHSGALESGIIRVQGPERIAILGDNGTGKTTLLRTLLGEKRRIGAFGIPRTDRIGYLSQKLDDLDDDRSILDTIQDAAPHLSPGSIRNYLARFLIRRDNVHHLVGTLSGGERFRISLARLLLTEPIHQLLLLDEPTNNLDTDTTAQLVGALADYRGGIIVVSHDQHFLQELKLDRILELDVDGRLSDISSQLT